MEENKRGDLFEATSLLDSHQLLDLLKSTNPNYFALSVAAAFPILYLLIEFVLQTEIWLSSCFINFKLENNLFTCKNAWTITEIHLVVNCDWLYEELALGVVNAMSKTKGIPAMIY